MGVGKKGRLFLETNIRPYCVSFFYKNLIVKNIRFFEN